MDNMNDLERTNTTNETIRAFIDLVLMEKYADLPIWMDFDLTVSQVKSIYLLASYQNLTISKLARLLGTGNPAASILVQQMVEHGLFERTEDLSDRRRTLVSLTSRGKQLMNGRIDLRETQFRRRLSQMTDEDLSGLHRGIKALVDIIRSEEVEFG